jgi:hypothetical protein
MKLQQVDLNHNGFSCVCIDCNKAILPREPRKADLDGKPFVDYYCEKCAKQKGEK